LKAIRGIASELLLAYNISISKIRADEKFLSSYIYVRKKTILCPYTALLSFINTTIERTAIGSQECNEKALDDNNAIVPFRCNICSFGSRQTDYLNNNVTIAPGQSFILDDEPIICYMFNNGSRYRIKFAIHTGKTGLKGQSEWVYFQIPK
jgi:hypothetical protein